MRDPRLESHARLAPPRGKLRVLSVIHPFRPEFTGEGEWWLRMAGPLRARGVRVEILTTQPAAGRALDLEVVGGVPVHRLRLTGERPYWARMRAVLVALARWRGLFDVALFHSPNHDTVFPACVLGRLLGWKTVYRPTLTGSDDFLSVRHGGRFGVARILALRLAHGHICLSEAVSRSFEEAGLSSRNRVIVPQGVDTVAFQPATAESKRAARSRLGIPEEAPVVLFCGSIMARKGVDVLAAAWRRVCAEHARPVLLMVGPNHRDGLVPPEDAAFAQAIESRLSDLVQSGRVRMTGCQWDVRPYYAAADVFVLPSRAEGSANVLSEAMACGLPCVVSTVSREQVRDGVEGFVVANEDPSAYAQRLLGLLADPERAMLLGGRGRRRVAENQDVNRVADQLAAFFEAVHAAPTFPAGKPARPGLAPPEPVGPKTIS